MKRLDIIVHEHDRIPLERQFTLGLLANEWRQAEIDVRIVRGVHARPDADLVVLHVDLSVVPEKYLQVAERYPRAVNGRIGDIRKSVISKQIVYAGDSWAGPVIVKTDLNYGGRPEARLASSAPHARVMRVIFGRKRVLPALAYEHFQSIQEVPESIWSDPTRIVEKFLPEIDGDLYVLRKYLFLGETGINWVFRSPDPIVRGGTVVETRREQPPEEILKVRRSLGIDFGRLDYVMTSSKVTLLDVNKTPSYTGDGPSPRMQAASEELWPAIERFF